MLNIHVECEASILKSAALKKELAESGDGMNAVEICDSQRHECSAQVRNCSIGISVS